MGFRRKQIAPEEDSSRARETSSSNELTTRTLPWWARRTGEEPRLLRRNEVEFYSPRQRKV